MNSLKTEQEKFWAGEFGNEYVERNQGEILLASDIYLFAKILAGTRSVCSVIEFGANIGLNLQAINQLLPEADLSAVEINLKAVKELEKIKRIKIYHQSILDFSPDYMRDFVFTKGTLIHINPDNLSQVYDTLYKSSKCYICLAEYYNPTPVEVKYRGFQGKLFKRDFAGEMLDRYKDLRLINYGFIYHRDENFPQDDITWFLLEKREIKTS